MDIPYLVDTLGKAIDVAGVGIIGGGMVLATITFVQRMILHEKIDTAFPLYRRSLARVILLGLEFLVAADIVRSVAIAPSFTSVGILAIIVMIRSFLSMELSLEVEGHWPWQKGEKNKSKYN